LSSIEWGSFRRLVAWLCNIFWIFLAMPFTWIEMMALRLLSLTVDPAESTNVDGLGLSVAIL